jgi:hypothetical protein
VTDSNEKEKRMFFWAFNRAKREINNMIIAMARYTTKVLDNGNPIDSKS